MFAYKVPGHGEELIKAEGVEVTDGEWHEAMVALTGQCGFFLIWKSIKSFKH